MGKLFVIDGTDGSGKQTQFKKLQERLDKEGIDYKTVSFPKRYPAISTLFFVIISFLKHPQLKLLPSLRCYP